MALSTTELDELLDYTFQNNPDNLVLNLTATLNSPSGATFLATVTGGVVSTISILLRGTGYPSGTFDLSFVGGSPSVTASATAVAAEGKIQSITLVDGGSGYGSTPAVNLFSPDKQINFITPTNKTSSVTDEESFFRWYNPTSLTTPVELIFPTPTQTLTTVPVSVPSGFLVPVRSEGGYSTWRVRVVSSGYGYTTTPTISHKPMFARGIRSVPVSTRVLNNQKRIYGGGSGQSGESSQIIVNNGGYIPNRLVFELNSYEDLATAFYDRKNPTYPTGIWGVSNLKDKYKVVAFYEAPSFVLNRRQVVVGADLGDRDMTGLFIYGQNSSLPILNLIKGSYGVQVFFVVEQIGGTRPTKHCVGRITYGQSDPSYDVRIYTGGEGQQQIAGTAGERITTLGGGMLAPVVEIIDAGSGYTSGQPVRLRRISGASSNQAFSSTTDQSLVGSIGFSNKDFFDSAISSLPTVSTASSTGVGTNIVLGNSGMGFGSNIEVIVPEKTYTGAVVCAFISNLDQIISANSYVVGGPIILQCEVQGPPSGITAKLFLDLQNITPKITIACPGSGYTSAPIVTAPAPNARTRFGKVSIDSTNLVNGYSLQPNGISKEYPLEISPSPVSGGDASAVFTVFGNPNSPEQLKTAIARVTNEGFGYITAPIVTAPSPDSINHFISSIQLTNTPEGYTDGQTYNLQIGASPVTGGNAKASLTKLNASSYLVTIDEPGYGYSAGVPSITAPGPDVKQGKILAITTTTSGRGYAPGVYEVSVDSAPAGGESATAELEIQSNGVAVFRPINPGFGYVTAPNVSAVTPIGNLISGITITCQGSFYIDSTAQFTIDDPGGQGANLGKPFISNGKITGINVIDGGYGFTNTPKITFNPPTPPAEKVYPPNTIVNKFNITTASANAILTTANQRDVLLEVYETDGANEQVVVQGVVNLTKRVLE